MLRDQKKAQGSEGVSGIRRRLRGSGSGSMEQEDEEEGHD
jgi:hypothetical protein